MNIHLPYLVFLGDQGIAKTGRGVHHWRPDSCIGQFRFNDNPEDLGLPDMTLQQAVDHGARTLLIGIAPPGGQLPQNWIPHLQHALQLGLDIAAGLHTRLNLLPQLKSTADQHHRQIFDVRHPDQSFEMDDFPPRPGKRLLTVGTDCSVGKMYTTLALENEMRTRGYNVDARATGQTGILILGGGIAVDAVVADFISAAAASLSPANSPVHWDIIEGQGSLFHPAYSGVTLGLLHGSQPDTMVLCTDPTRTTIHCFDHYPQPSLPDAIDAYTRAARITNPRARVIGISMNTASLPESDAINLLYKTRDQTNLPCVDPLRTGVAPLVDALNFS